MTPAPRPERMEAPSSYGLGRGDDEPGALLPWPDVERWLEGARNYWVTTVREDGRPHAIPVWGVWLEGAVWFSTDPGSIKGRNLARDPRTVIHLESGDDVAILDGAVEAPGAAAPLDPFIEAYDAKYGFRIEPSGEAMGIYLLRPRTALAWRESDYPRSATRWVFAD